MQGLMVILNICLFVIPLSATPSDYAIASGILTTNPSLQKFYKEKYKAPLPALQMAKCYKAAEFYSFLDKLEKKIKDPRLLNKIVGLSQCKWKPYTFNLDELAKNEIATNNSYNSNFTASFQEIDDDTLIKKYNLTLPRFQNFICTNVQSMNKQFKLNTPIYSKFIREIYPKELPDSFFLLLRAARGKKIRPDGDSPYDYNHRLHQMFLFGCINKKLYLRSLIASTDSYWDDYFTKGEKTLLIPIATPTFAELKEAARLLAYPNKKFSRSGLFELSSSEPIYNKEDDDKLDKGNRPTNALFYALFMS